MTATEANDNSGGDMLIPRWFIWIVSLVGGCFVIGFIPWATWVTVALLTITAQNGIAMKNEARLDAIITRFQDHLADPEIHHALLKGPIRDLDRRVEALEHKGLSTK